MGFKHVLKEIMPIKWKYICYQEKSKKKLGEVWECLKENVRFKGIHEGERCFIIGNGPSINNIDFSILANEITFTVNQLPRRDDFEKIRTNYHMWADERFFEIDECKEEDMELLQIMKKVKSNASNPVVFYMASAYDMIKRFSLDKELEVAYFSTFGFADINSGVDFDFCKSVPYSPTVIHYLILLAVYMGFKEIYLLGCDCTGIINTIQSRIKSSNEMSYGYIVSENERKRMQKSNSMFPIQNELRWYADIFDKYEKLNEYCLNRGVSLFNATEGSLLECVKKVDLVSVLTGKKGVIVESSCNNAN